MSGARVAEARGALLEAKGLWVETRDRALLRGVDLRLEAGELLGVVGPNGAGKSTLLRTLAGLLAPSRGDLRLQGEPLASLGRKVCAQRLAYLPQEIPFDLPYTVLEVVLMGRSPHLGPLGLDGPSDRVQAWEAMERSGAAAFAHRAFGSLSGGERQRVLLARILAQAAPIWLLDEPTAHLDLGNQHLALRLARQQAGAGGAAICVLHDLGQAAQACDRVALLAEGALQAVGPPEEVLQPPLLERHFGVPFGRARLESGEEHLVPLAPFARNTRP